MHVDVGTLRTRLSEAADAARVLEMKYVGISSIPADERRYMPGAIAASPDAPAARRRVVAAI